MRLCSCFILLTMASVASAEWKVSPEAMVTRWGKQVTPQNAWQEYPRPQFRRDENWENLNGLWKFAISQNGVMPHDYQGDILVPFPVESALSGVQRLLAPDDIELRVPSEKRSHIHLSHMLIVHCLLELLDAQLFGID